MKSAGESFAAQPGQARAYGITRAFAEKAGDLLPVSDFACLLITGYFSLFTYGTLIAPAFAQVHAWDDLQRLIWISAAIAPFMLYEQHFASHISAGNNAVLVRGLAARFTILLGVVCAIAFAGRWLAGAPPELMVLWFGSLAVLTVSTRVLLALYLRRLIRQKAMAAAVQWPADDCPDGFSSGLDAQRIGYVGDRLPVMLLADRPIKRWNAVLKAGSDLVLGFFIVVITLPAVGCIALAIKLDSPGPVLFKQRRHGLNNREFEIYKFRTMRSDSADSGAVMQQTVRGDSRTTRVGRFLRKWSLDELPQVFNVLEGNMSLVGPRPHAVNMRTEQQLGHEIIDVYPHRHRVKPGITGWSQINGSRGATDTTEQLRRRIELDLYYVENWSLLLDLKILSLTSREVLRATNAY